MINQWKCSLALDRFVGACAAKLVVRWSPAQENDIFGAIETLGNMLCIYSAMSSR